MRKKCHIVIVIIIIITRIIVMIITINNIYQRSFLCSTCFVLINILNITFHASTAHKSAAYLGKFNNPLFHICNLRAYNSPDMESHPKDAIYQHRCDHQKVRFQSLKDLSHHIYDVTGCFLFELHCTTLAIERMRSSHQNENTNTKYKIFEHCTTSPK